LIELNYAPSRKDLRLFAIILVPFSYFLGWIIRRQFDPDMIGWSINIVLAIAGVTGSIWPAAVKQIFLVWTVITYPIGWVVSHLVLAIIFFGVFLPIGFTMKCFGYDPLQLREKNCDSYWVPLEPITDQERYFRQF